MFKKCALVAALVFAAVSRSNALHPETMSADSSGIVKVGTDEIANIHVDAGESRTDTITYPGANYISVRFSDFNLPPGDEVIVRSPDSSTVHRYSGKGRNDAGSFISSLVPGGKAIVEYVSKNKDLHNTVPYGYTIPGFARGFPHPPLTAVCGTDQSIPAKCFKEGTPSQDLPQAYNKARAVARLLVNGTNACTGFLAGSEGHLITSSHCVQYPETALVTDVEFDAESTSCEEECRNWFGCKGAVVTGSPMFIAFDGFFDYVLLKIPPAVDVSKYGYLQLRGSGPDLGEEIYIPQHPKGNAKRIAYKVDDGKKATITSIRATVPCGEDLIEYKADTQPGSSGSPVLASNDNLVVALHRCGSCPNYGADAANIIKSLKYKKIVIKDLIVGGPRTLPPVPAPTKPAGFCAKYTGPSSCRIWFWCTWDASTDTCLNRW